MQKKLQKKCLIYRILPSLLLLAALFSLAGCGKTGKLNEGDCKGIISFTDIPKEFHMLEQNLKENFEIHVTLKNMVNEKQYEISLNSKNDYKQEVSLHPGTYQVYMVYASQAANTGISIAADSEKMEFTKEGIATLHVSIDNPEEFTRHWMSVQPMPEMLLAEPFDGLIQINRQIFDLRAEDSSPLLSQLDISFENTVAPFKQVTLTDSNLGITVTLLNDSEEEADWKNCRLIEIYVTKNNAVFPQGVTLGMAIKDVCNKSTGLYGEPDSFTGSLLYGWNFDNTSAVYRDEESGDEMTISLGSGSGINNIRYRLQQFED